MSGLRAVDYHVGWICALHIELVAAIAMLDEEHRQMDTKDRDENYVLGRVHHHNVVIAFMPEGVDGLVAAANVARDMLRVFSAIKVGLLVGIGGGIPNLPESINIRLGDVVVSRPEKTWGGVVQYDKGKAEDGGNFVVKGHLNQPPALLLQTLTQIRARHTMQPNKIPDYIAKAIMQTPMMEDGFAIPDEPDCLHCRYCHGDIDDPATDCEALHIKRKVWKSRQPVIH